MTEAIALAPGCWPVVGHTVAMLRDPLRFFASLTYHSKIVQIRIGTLPVVVICDAGLARQMLRDDAVFDKGGFIGEQARKMTGENVVTATHCEHRRIRRQLQPAVAAEQLARYAPEMTKAADALTAKWTPGQLVDAIADMNEVTARILTGTMFGDTLRLDVRDQFIADVHSLMFGFFLDAFAPAWARHLPIPALRRYYSAEARLRETCRKTLSKRRAQTNPGTTDLLTAMLQPPDASPCDETDRHFSELTDAEILDNILVFFLSGFDTAAATLTWALHLLATNPPIADRLHDEVDAVLAGRAATGADLPQLPITQSVIYETLRLWPPGWILPRTTSRDTELAHHRVPAGTTVLCSPYALHHSPHGFHDPELPVIDRWIGEHAHRSHELFFAFGSGPRTCISKQFALNQVTIVLATIAARWHLQYSTTPHVRPLPANLLLSPKGVQLRATPRNAFGTK